MFSILAWIAEFETALRAERQIEGIVRAQKNGVALGRKAKLTDAQIYEMRQKRADGVLVR